MPRRDSLPENASTAAALGGGKLTAPAAERNAGPIADLVAEFAPESGRALELASGTGQHAVALARRLPGLDWQPSEIDEARLASIRAWAAEAGLPNLRAPVTLDATAPGWAAGQAPRELILVINLLHLISAAECETLISEAARALAPGGVLVIYGPFMRAGELTSEGDRAFHARLTAADPEIGYKDDFDTLDMIVAAGLAPRAVIEMPANNLGLVAGRDS